MEEKKQGYDGIFRILQKIDQLDEEGLKKFKAFLEKFIKQKRSEHYEMKAD